MLRFHILLTSYNRPTMLREALYGIHQLNYPREFFKVTIIDDASTIGNPGRSCEEILGESIRWNCVHIEDTKEAKLARKGSWIGREMNRSILYTESDVIIWTMDDDIILPCYLIDLNQYYLDNPEVKYAYCNLIEINRDGEKVGPHWLNNSVPLPPPGRLDASQVTYRRECFIDHSDIRFPYPKTSCLDADLFAKLELHYGLCQPTNIIGQKKRTHENQLGNHSSLDRVD